MYSIKPDFPWFPYLRICDSPEAQLIYAIILTAWEDSNKAFECPDRAEARKWFFSNEFKEYCELVKLPMTVIQEFVTKHWSVE